MSKLGTIATASLGGIIVGGLLQAMVLMGDFAKGNLFLQWMPLIVGVTFTAILYFIMRGVAGEKNK